jgi:hypothetical protein
MFAMPIHVSLYHREYYEREERRRAAAARLPKPIRVEMSVPKKPEVEVKAAVPISAPAKKRVPT